MLDLKLLSNELLMRKDDIIDFEQEASDLMDSYKIKLPTMDTLDKSINDRLGPYSGSKVLEEGAFIRHFKQQFASRSKATDWALEILQGRTIAAVDGSQILPSRRYSVPIGVAQAGLVINRHTQPDGFSTSQKLSIIIPKDFEDYSGASAYSQTPVSLKRHQLECEQIIRFMHENPGNLVFLDGSLVMSFINQFDDQIRRQYAASIVELLKASEETRTPVAAYTDMSLNKDIVTLMKKHFKLRPTTHLTDAHLIRDLLRWGDRTRAFLSDRDDRMKMNEAAGDNPSVLDLYGPYRDSIAFFYIQSSGGLPSKVELPKWAFEAGMADHITDVVRAECIIRPGYPDIIHRAHEYTVVGNGDTERFNGMLDAFAEQNKIKIYKSAKELNKRI
jgi:hypothetical protein